jgi:uncharacterized membrane protein YeaQ/YmgE (transglycosylase-associated protein family)
VGIVSFLVFGLIAGAVARLVTPGRQAIGCLPTLVVGIVGAFVGGVIGNEVLGHKEHFGWHLGPFLLAVMGAVIVLLALDAISGKRRLRRPW